MERYSSNSVITEIEEYDHEYIEDFVVETLELLELGELEEEFTTCNACFGTGMDRELDADCLICWGDGVV